MERYQRPLASMTMHKQYIEQNSLPDKTVLVVIVNKYSAAKVAFSKYFYIRTWSFLFESEKLSPLWRGRVLCAAVCQWVRGRWQSRRKDPAGVRSHFCLQEVDHRFFLGMGPFPLPKPSSHHPLRSVV